MLGTKRMRDDAFRTVQVLKGEDRDPPTIEDPPPRNRGRMRRR
ncbi:hypothetical protein [Dactylosporangium roseum]|nr:hypothetical protein [Dactylosporangium roseum]